MRIIGFYKVTKTIFLPSADSLRFVTMITRKSLGRGTLKMRTARTPHIRESCCLHIRQTRQQYQLPFSSSLFTLIKILHSKNPGCQPEGAPMFSLKVSEFA
jgi:hypothetical protein